MIFFGIFWKKTCKIEEKQVKENVEYERIESVFESEGREGWLG